jgi:hypothetical protein
MSLEIALYRELVNELESGDSLCEAQVEELYKVVRTKDVQITQYKAHSEEIGGLMAQTLTASEKVLQDNLELRIKSRWMFAGGVTLGISVTALLFSLAQE